MISPHCGAIKLVSLKGQRHLLSFRIAKLLHRHYGSVHMYRDEISIKQDAYLFKGKCRQCPGGYTYLHDMCRPCHIEILRTKDDLCSKANSVIVQGAYTFM